MSTAAFSKAVQVLRACCGCYLTILCHGWSEQKAMRSSTCPRMFNCASGSFWFPPDPPNTGGVNGSILESCAGTSCLLPLLPHDTLSRLE